MDLAPYRTLVFDCDGVLLDSNGVKSDAFYQSALPFGEVYASRLLAYHKKNGGVSRYRKFEYFLADIVGQGVPGPGYDELLDAYARLVAQGMTSCRVAEGLEELRVRSSHSNWVVASGGDQRELRDLFRVRGLDDLFDGGIFGSPDSKVEIVARELRLGNIRTPALFLGDSRYDFEVSEMFAGVEFVYLHAWSEVVDWRAWVDEYNISFVASLSNL